MKAFYSVIFILLFRIDGVKIRLDQFDTFETPVNALHEVEGLGERKRISLNTGKRPLRFKHVYNTY